MPGQMPETLSRGANLIALDRELATAKNRKRAVRKMLSDLPAGADPLDEDEQARLADGLVKLTGDHGVFTGKDLEHFRDHWLGGAWWPEAHPIAPILRHAYVKAIDIALGEAPERPGGAELDIETLWFCTPPPDQGPGDVDIGRVHVAITWSERVVTVGIHTPRLPEPAQDPTVKEPVVVVRWEGDKSRGIAVVQPGA